MDWEAAWAPYDADTYAAALSFLRPDDVVLDIGAGDLRFARLAATRVRRVIAMERNWDVLPHSQSLPQRERGAGALEVICADALTFPFPRGVTAGVLLMRHCRRFREYATKLRDAGCFRLITNARWGMGVEEVRLDAPRAPYRNARSQWYACACGAVGFAPGPVEVITPASLDQVVEVAACPACSEVGSREQGAGSTKVDSILRAGTNCRFLNPRRRTKGHEIFVKLRVLRGKEAPSVTVGSIES